MHCAAGYAALLDALAAAGTLRSPRVREALAGVDRKFFCQREPGCYDDNPQRIGWGITISAPHMHVMALEMMLPKLTPGSTVLDVGSGSGFLTAALAELVGPAGRAVGVDHIDELVEWSRANVARAGKQPLVDAGRLSLLVRDGFGGYPEAAPYDAIHVGAAPETIPEALKQQLKPGGVMILPVGKDGGDQQFVRVTRSEDGSSFAEQRLFGVRYVPLTTKERQLRNA